MSKNHAGLTVVSIVALVLLVCSCIIASKNKDTGITVSSNSVSGNTVDAIIEESTESEVKVGVQGLDITDTEKLIWTFPKEEFNEEAFNTVVTTSYANFSMQPTPSEEEISEAYSDMLSVLTEDDVYLITKPTNNKLAIYICEPGDFSANFHIVKVVANAEE